MSSEEQVEKFHTDDVSLPTSLLLIGLPSEMCVKHSKALPRSDTSS